jgi:hypothetical protein
MARFSETRRLLKIKRVLVFFITFLTIFLILRRTERDVIIMYCGLLHVKCPSFLSDFNETLTFSIELRKISKCHENTSSRTRVFFSLLNAEKQMCRN